MRLSNWTLNSSRTLVGVALTITTWGCDVVRGSGLLVEEERELAEFERISIEGSSQVEFTQGDERRLTIEAEDNIIRELVTEVRRGTLVLGAKQGVLLEPTVPIQIRVVGPELTQLSITGTGDFTSSRVETDELNVAVSGRGSARFGQVESSEVNIRSSGAGDVTLDKFTGDSATVALSGTGSVGLAGRASDQSVHITGSGRYLGVKLKTKSTLVQIEGSGDAEVFAEETLGVDISGSGDVRFKGSPSITSFLSGSGTLSPLD